MPWPGLLGPCYMGQATPSLPAPDLCAAPVVRRRDGSSVIIGFRNLEPKGQDGFEILDPIPAPSTQRGYLVAR